MKFICPVCGYVYDEAKEKSSFSSLPETWQCPICKAAKSLFTPQEEETPATGGEPAPVEELRPLTPGELAAVFSNLARGCEKQYHPEEEACFQKLAAYFTGLAPQEPDASVAQLLAFFQEDLAQGYPAYQAAAQAAGDRGSQRVRVWGEKVTTMARSLCSLVWFMESSLFSKPLGCVLRHSGNDLFDFQITGIQAKVIPSHVAPTVRTQKIVVLSADRKSVV